MRKFSFVFNTTVYYYPFVCVEEREREEEKIFLEAPEGVSEEPFIEVIIIDTRVLDVISS